jgi:hypothetical protein
MSREDKTLKTLNEFGDILGDTRALSVRLAIALIDARRNIATLKARIAKLEADPIKPYPPDDHHCEPSPDRPPQRVRFEPSYIGTERTSDEA